MLQKRKLDKLFEKNGGEMLRNVKGLTIFTKDGLRKITKDNAEFLGNGSFGNVYKGTLPDQTAVAVKASIKVDETTKVEFVEEVEIQTQMIHKNILKLVGCCLEVDVPVLVYEFAANGSLQDILHGKKNQVLPLDSRLEIAIGSAEGLKYMHSYATHAMRHGDVKPDNILLDDKLTPKIADFGLSKLLKEEYVAKVVVGCMGYIDPVFMKTGLLTQKSDVYSFGAVLLELITGKRNVYDQQCSLIIEYRKVYENARSGRAMFDIDIATEEDIPVLEEMGKLAMDCLNEDLENRPDMTEVAEQLVMIRRNKKFNKPSSSNPNNIGEVTIYNSPTNTEVTGTTSAHTSAKSTPYNMDILPSP
jgi:serine/threonine protein kinase